MATSGSFNTTGYQGRYLTFSWSQTNQSTANNSTLISWTLKGAGSAQSNWYNAGNFKVVINGITVYQSSTRIKLYEGTVVASGNLTINHDSNGNAKLTASAEAGIYQVAVNSKGSGTWSLDQIARQATITSASNFTDEQNPTIGYSNPAGNNVTSLQACISLTGNTDDIKYRDIPKTGTSYTFNLTDADRQLLYNNSPNTSSFPAFFYIKTVIAGQTYYNIKQVSVSIVNALPDFAAPTYADTSTKTVEITGDNQRIIQNQSNLQITIPEAIAKKGASIVNYIVEINAIQKNQSSAGTMDWGTLDASNNITATAAVADSRGNIVEKDFNIIIEPRKQP